MTNLQEFLAGTDPRDDDDRLRLQPLGMAAIPGGWAVAVGFPARSNKTYSILYRNGSASGAWTNLVNIHSQPTNRFVTVTNLLGPEIPSRFFRLATPLLP